MSLVEHRISGTLIPADEDLRPNLLALLILALGLAALHQLAPVLLVLAGVAVLAVLCRVPGAQVLHRLRHVEGFLLVLLVLLPITTPGQPLFSLGPLSASAEGLERALLIAAKVNAMALALLALLGSASPERLGGALVSLQVPPRFVQLLDLVLRHSHTARDSFRRQHEAMRARGFRPRSNLHSWRCYGLLMGGGLLRALSRGERVEEAMRLRRGHGHGAFHLAPQGPLQARSLAKLVLMALAMAALVALDRLA